MLEVTAAVSALDARRGDAPLRSDKPDLRFALELADVAEAFAGTRSRFSRSASETARIVAVRYPGGAALSRRDFDALTETREEVWRRRAWSGSRSARTVGIVAAKLLDDATSKRFARRAGGRNRRRDLALRRRRARWRPPSPGRYATRSASDAGCATRRRSRSVGCSGFRIFEIDAETGKPAPAHHPVHRAGAGPMGSCIDTDPMAMRAQHYDMVLNGWELGTGSIRIHKPEQQRRSSRCSA